MKYVPDVGSKEIDKEINEFIKATQASACENINKEFKAALSSYDFDSVKALVDYTIESQKGYEENLNELKDSTEKLSKKSDKLDTRCETLTSIQKEVENISNKINDNVIEITKSLENHSIKSTNDHSAINSIMKEHLDDSLQKMNSNIEIMINESEKRTKFTIVLFMLMALCCQFYFYFVWVK